MGSGEDILGCVEIGAKVERVMKAMSARHGTQQVNRAPASQVHMVSIP